MTTILTNDWGGTERLLSVSVPRDNVFFLDSYKGSKDTECQPGSDGEIRQTLTISSLSIVAPMCADFENLLHKWAI